MRPSASKGCTSLPLLAALAAPAIALGGGSVTRVKLTNSYDPNPNAVIYIGDRTVYEAVLGKQGDMVTHVKWQYQWVNCNPGPNPSTVAWIDSDGESAVSVGTDESACGRKDVSVTVTFRNYMTGQSHDSVGYVSVGVQYPDGCSLVQPPASLGVATGVVPFQARGNLAVKFVVQGGGRTLYFQSVVHEALDRTNFQNSRADNKKNRSLRTASDLYFTGPGEIVDYKGVNNDQTGAAFGLMTNGGNPPVDEFIQTLAVDIPLGCGGTVVKIIGSFHLRVCPGSIFTPLVCNGTARLSPPAAAA